MAVEKRTTLRANLHYRLLAVLRQNRITSGVVHLRGLAPGHHSSLETSRRRRAVGTGVYDWTSPGIEPRTSSTDNDVLANER